MKRNATKRNENIPEWNKKKIHGTERNGKEQNGKEWKLKILSERNGLKLFWTKRGSRFYSIELERSETGWNRKAWNETDHFPYPREMEWNEKNITLASLRNHFIPFIPFRNQKFLASSGGGLGMVQLFVSLNQRCLGSGSKRQKNYINLLAKL